ncbi:MAG: 3-deoxy-manno-octulosonate cytidylyltransferase [Victivallaceae bacterium]|nr:3-deoxy-manno-octulosonate cytidylyltransferase [Victivallaceae bacterium]
MTDIPVSIMIPARYQSSRFPGKPLAMLCGKPMIQHVYEKAAASCADEVIVATDDARIFDAVTAFGGKAVMTRADHPSGTDRIREAAASSKAEIFINVQGDEPLIPTEVIDELIAKMKNDPSIGMATVAVPASREELANPNKVKVVFGADGKALYFSRALIPFLRAGGEDPGVFLHWGIYAYRRKVLDRFVALPQGRLEQCEKLEQLRALENGISIAVIVSNLESVGVDTPEDLVRAEAKLLKQQTTHR